MKSSVHKTTAGLLFLCLILAQVNFFPQKALAAKNFKSYVIKLVSPGHFGKLVGIGQNIAKKFAFSIGEEFNNIYTFSSVLSLQDLKSQLQDSFVYLEEQKDIAAHAVQVNDPGFTLDAQNIDKQWGLPKAGFPDAWEKTVGSHSNVVAVIDTGIDETHEDLKDADFTAGFDFINNQALSPGSNSDDNGHGTLVAGVLGATANNGLGIVGTNWQIAMMPLKVLDSKGEGNSTDVAEAIVWATDKGVGFINLSLGGVGYGNDTTLANAVTYAFNKNVIIVAAAGNDGAAVGGNLDESPSFPICADNNFNMIIGVAATDKNDLKPEFSNYGKNCVDVTAPGRRILSTINFDPSTQISAPNSYIYVSGTSLAVPLVVGQAALIRSMYPQATNAQIRDRIIATAEPIDNLNLSQCGGSSCRGFLGAGRINVSKSLMTAIDPQFAEWDLVKVTDLNDAIYQIVGGQKRLVSSFVYYQRFANATLKTASLSQLSAFPEGPYVTPLEGTLVKYDQSPTVYIVQNGQKMPLTGQVFNQRNLKFTDVHSLSVSELDSWTTGNFFPPLEGTLLKTFKNKTIYWVIGQALHPLNNKFYVEKGLNIFPILIVPDTDINSFAKGEAYIR